MLVDDIQQQGVKCQVCGEVVYGLQVLSNSLFAGLSRAQRIQSEREHSQHHVWSTDFRSQMSNALESFDLDSVDVINVA